MKKYIDDLCRLNELRMLLKHPSYKEKIIVIVEGDSDIKLYRSLIPSSNKVKVQSLNGKKPLINSIKILLSEGYSKIIGICDADFDNLTGCSSEHKNYNVFVTDTHDAEIMMFSSPSFDSFIAEYSNNNNINEIKLGIKKSILDIAYKIGILRWINYEKDYKLNFKAIKIQKYLQVSELHIKLDNDRLINELISVSPNKKEGVTKTLLFDLIDKYKKKSACKLQVCCGHDVTNILSILFRQDWVSADTNMGTKRVKSSLRLAYKLEFFKKTTLYECIVKWANSKKINIFDT